MGIAAIVAGVVHIASWWKRKRSLGSVILGVFYSVFGLAVAFNPIVSQGLIVLLLPFWAIFAGVSVMVSGRYRALRGDAHSGSDTSKS